MAFEGFTTVIDKASGEILREVDWDTYIRGNINSLLVPPMCVLRSGTAWSFSTNDEVTFGTADVLADTNSMHGTANPERITVSVPGLYHVWGGIVGFGTASSDNRIDIEVNGTAQAVAPLADAGGACSLLWLAGSGDHFAMQVSPIGGSYTPSLAAVWQGGTA